MLTNQQINTVHRLHFVENWTVRKIARHLHIGRRTVAKYLIKPAQAPLHRTRTSKLDPFKPAIDEWLQQDYSVTAAVLFQRLRDQGFAGGYTIVKDHLQAVRSETKTVIATLCRRGTWAAGSSWKRIRLPSPSTTSISISFAIPAP